MDTLEIYRSISPGVAVPLASSKASRARTVNSEVGIANLYEAVYSVRPKWYNFGLALEVPPTDLDCVRIKFQGDPSDCLREIIKARLKFKDKLKWTEVINALRKPMVGENALADQIQSEKACDTQDAVSMGDLEMSFRKRHNSDSDVSQDSGTFDDSDVDSLGINCKCPCGSQNFSHCVQPPPECLKQCSGHSYPELDLKEGADRRQIRRAQEYLELAVLKQRTEDIKHMFVEFTMDLRTNLHDIPRINSYLSDYIRSFSKQPSRSTDFDDLLTELCELADFINYEPLKMIAQRCAKYDRQLEVSLKKYEDAFVKYAQQRVYTFEQHLPNQADGVKLKVKIEEDFKTFPTERIIRFKNLIKKVLKMDDQTQLRMQQVREGCVEITYYIPRKDADKAFSNGLTLEQKRELASHKISMLQCDGIDHYCYCSLFDDQASHDLVKDMYKDVCMNQSQGGDLKEETEKHAEDCILVKHNRKNDCPLEVCGCCGKTLRSCFLEYHSLTCDVKLHQESDASSQLTDEDGVTFEAAKDFYCEDTESSASMDNSDSELRMSPVPESNDGGHQVSQLLIDKEANINQAPEAKMSTMPNLPATTRPTMMNLSATTRQKSTCLMSLLLLPFTILCLFGCVSVFYAPPNPDYSSISNTNVPVICEAANWTQMFNMQTCSLRESGNDQVTGVDMNPGGATQKRLDIILFGTVLILLLQAFVIFVTLSITATIRILRINRRSKRTKNRAKGTFFESNSTLRSPCSQDWNQCSSDDFNMGPPIRSEEAGRTFDTGQKSSSIQKGITNSY